MHVRGQAKGDDMIIEGLFLGTVSTVDATLTTIYQFVPTNNSCVRVEAAVVGAGVGVNCSFGKIATFKTVAGVVTAVGAVATIGSAEENVATDMTISTDGTLIVVKVTGIAATNMNWRVVGGTIYQA
jgi:hypothetical protein